MDLALLYFLKLTRTYILLAFTCSKFAKLNLFLRIRSTQKLLAFSKEIMFYAKHSIDRSIDRT